MRNDGLLCTSGVPSFTSSEITIVLPGDAVLSGIAVRVVNSSTTIGPEGVVEAVVCSSGWSSYRLAFGHLKVRRGSEDASHRRQTHDKGRKIDHDDIY